MPDTITAYHTFSSGTKARSSEVNANFSNYRGDLIPIDPNTAGATSLTYDMGTTDYRWRDWYGRGLNLIGMTTTANLQITRDNTATLGSFQFLINGVTAASLDPGGFKRASLRVLDSTSGVGSISNLVVGTFTNVSYKLDTTLVATIASARITNRSGGTIEVAIQADRWDVAFVGTSTLYGFDVAIGLYRGLTTTSMNLLKEMRFQQFANTTTASVLATQCLPLSMKWFDNSAPTGEVVYNLTYVSKGNLVGITSNVNNALMALLER